MVCILYTLTVHTIIRLLVNMVGKQFIDRHFLLQFNWKHKNNENLHLIPIKTSFSAIILSHKHII